MSSTLTGTILVHCQSSPDSGQRWRQALCKGMMKTATLPSVVQLFSSISQLNLKDKPGDIVYFP